jgi:type II secretory pathway predicted ATPase ExeA
MDNPFTPSYGSIPPLFAGRREIISQVAFGLRNGPGDPNRSTVLTGPRGSGKTVLMHEIAAEAAGLGWISVYVVSNSVMLDEMLRRLHNAAREHVEERGGARIKGVSVGGFGIELEYGAEEKSWEERLDGVVSALSAQGIGVLFEIDEVRGSSERLRRFASMFQTFIGEGRQTALVMAGLPHNIDSLFRDKVISFIRRSRRQDLEPIDYAEVKYTLRETAGTAGKAICEGALEIMARETAGFPYLIQLVGYEVWQAAGGRKRVTEEDARLGVANAQKHIVSSVLELIWGDISEKDREFLAAVSRSDGPADMAHVAETLGVDSRYASQYRLRMIREGVIAPTARGYVDFVLPQFRGYIRELSG